VINGIHRALVKGTAELGITSELIMCFLRHLDQKSAFITLLQAQHHKDKIFAVGLDQKFEQVFERPSFKDT
jgi:adenosine deaminase